MIMKIQLKQSFWIIIILPIVVALFGCSEEEGPQPLEHNPNAPGIVENITVENLPGKARLTYTLPKDQDLLYVVARYTLENGTPMEVKASYYNNTMLLEGFAGLSSTEVKVSTANRSEVESAPVTVTVTPSKAPIYDVLASLNPDSNGDPENVIPDFGGIRVNALNPTREDIAILVMQINDDGDWEPLTQSIYTGAAVISKSIRDSNWGTDSQDFALAIRDRWLNVTDTLFFSREPLFEQLMPKSNYKAATLPNDAQSIGGNWYPISNMWDGELVEYWGSFFSDRSIDIGNHLETFDIGETTRISRLHIWQFSEPIGGKRLYYYLGAMKRFRIWGATAEQYQESVADGGSLTAWTLLGEYEIIKPSGLPYGEEDNDDLVAAQDGADFEISIDNPSVRYLRIECEENWVGQKFMAIAEINVYGNPNL